MLFITFVTSCETSSIKIWFVLAAGLAENLTQVVFRQPPVIQHVRTRFLSCETWNFLFFYIFSSPYNQLVIFEVIVFPLAAFVLFRGLSRKNAWLSHTRIKLYNQSCSSSHNSKNYMLLEMSSVWNVGLRAAGNTAVYQEKLDKQIFSNMILKYRNFSSYSY